MKTFILSNWSDLLFLALFVILVATKAPVWVTYLTCFVLVAGLTAAKQALKPVATK